MKSKPSHILITGASSGIGAALALAYAAPGIMLSLSGRNQERLEQIVQACRNKGADADGHVVDVARQDMMAEWIKGRDQIKPLDLVIANAGISGGTGNAPGGENDAQVREIFAVNVAGVFNTVHPAMDLMISRGSGQIAIMSSLAGYRGWPGAPAYCASKAAVKSYGESLRGALAPLGVQVSVICPGFVKSRMTDINHFPMPMLMDTPRAAELIIRKLARNQGRIAFPWPMTLAAWGLSVLPEALSGRLLAHSPAKTQVLHKTSIN